MTRVMFYAKKFTLCEALLGRPGTVPRRNSPRRPPTHRWAEPMAEAEAASAPQPRRRPASSWWSAAQGDGEGSPSVRRGGSEEMPDTPRKSMGKSRERPPGNFLSRRPYFMVAWRRGRGDGRQELDGLGSAAPGGAGKAAARRSSPAVRRRRGGGAIRQAEKIAPGTDSALPRRPRGVWSPGRAAGWRRRRACGS